MGVIDTNLKHSSPDPSLSGKVIRGSLWILGLRITNKVISFIRIPILAWLLQPEHFGLVGIAALTISIIETFTQPGLALALIRKKDDVDPYLDTVWTVSVIRSVCIFFLIYMAAPNVALFFSAPQAKDIIRIFSISVVIVGFRNPAVLYFQKELNFKKQYVYELSVALATLVVSASAAIILKNAWALVLGGIAGSITRLCMSYILHPYGPRFKVDKEKFVELFNFGKWILGSSILYFMVQQGDDIVLGRLFGVTMLGLYQMAYTLSDLPTTQISQVISHVTFPAYSKIQEDKLRLKRAYEKVFQLVLLGTVALVGGLFILASEFTKVVLSPKWLPVVPILHILLWAGLLKAIKTTTEPVFNALGKPALYTKCYFVQFIILGGAIFPMAKAFGATGIATAVLVSQTVSAVVALVLALRIIELSFADLSRILVVPFLSAGIMMLAVTGAKQVIQGNQVIVFVSLTGFGALVYLISILFVGKVFGLHIILLAKELWYSLRGKSSEGS